MPAKFKIRRKHAYKRPKISKKSKFIYLFIYLCARARAHLHVLPNLILNCRIFYQTMDFNLEEFLNYLGIAAKF